VAAATTGALLSCIGKFLPPDARASAAAVGLHCQKGLVLDVVVGEVTNETTGDLM